MKDDKSTDRKFVHTADTWSMQDREAVTGAKDVSERGAQRKAINRDECKLKLQRVTENLRALEAITEVALSTLDLNELLDALVERAVEVARADCSMILLIDESTNEVVPRAAYHIEPEVWKEFRVKSSEGLAGKVIAAKRPVTIRNAEADPSVATPYIRRRHIKSIIGVPLKVREKVIGVSYLYTLQERRFTSAEIRLFEVMADRAAMAINNALLVQAEQRRARELDAVIENMTEGLSIASPEGKILRINRIGREMLGIEQQPSESYGLLQDYFKAFSLRYPDGREVPPDEWPISKALRGETFVDMEVVFTRTDGHQLRLLFGGSPVRDDAGNIMLAVNVWRDITAFRELERRREQFINIVAHDIRTPLSIVIGQAQLIQRFAQDANSVRKSANAIVVSARRMNTMISDLVDSARIEARQLQLKKQPVDLKAFVSDLLERSAGVMNTARIKMDIHPGLPPLFADPDRLERVFTNLLGNALKYSPGETEVLISARRKDGEALISVADRGIGMPPEDIGHVFEAFYRGRGARGTEGLGLGLYIAKMLVEAHGGRIWVESQLGVGTTFYFTIPLVP